MKLMNQVCTLEQAKKLKALGVNQDSLYSWCGDETKRLMDNGKDGLAVSDWVYIDLTIPPNNQELDHRSMVPSAKPFAAAFTVAELGAMIGKGTNAAALFYDAVQARMNQSHSFTIALDVKFVANCVIGMLETGRMNIEEVNNRLLNE
jgi:hypothetical protein